MRIVIDMQGAQSKSSRDRGIGRYTLSVVQAIVRNRGRHDVFLALNGLFPETIKPIRQAFYGLVPPENIRIWQTPGTVHCFCEDNYWRRRTAELVREAFLSSLKPDMVLVSSLFEGLDDDAVTSIGVLAPLPTATVLYDLIPLIYPKLYLENPTVEAWYKYKLDHLRASDLLLAISESSRKEGVHHLGFSAEASINISSAVGAQFQPMKIDSEREQEVRLRYGLHRQFVMYTGGIDHRKNIERLIRAYADLPKSIRANHQLSIVCSIELCSRIDLESMAKKQRLSEDELVLTGFVPEDDLLALYNLCKAFVFPSWHEGFGLPALEAMSCGKAVIGANTSSLPEVIGRDDALFDPFDVGAITEKLAQVLTDGAFRSELEQYGLQRAKLFSWDTSAQRVMAAFEAWHSKKQKQLIENAVAVRRPKMAYISPLPPQRSGISDYSAELLPELSRHYEIDVVVAQDQMTDPWIKANCPLRSVEWFRENSALFDRVLYHFGNSHFHQHMFSLLAEVPGVVVLHDFFLSGIAAHMDHTGYRPGFWGQALYQSHGYHAVQQRFHAADKTEVVWNYPCNHEVLQRAIGVVAHSEISRRLATQWYGEGVGDEWAYVPLLRTPRCVADKAEARRLLELGGDDFVVCSFGLLGPTKLSQRLLNAWLVSDLAQNDNCVLVFVGENHNGDYGAELVATIERSGLATRIRITGWAESATFRNYLAAADMGVQLRTFSRGETSAAVLDCMNYGIPTIVNANGSMADLPDNAVLKLPDVFAEADLVNAMETLWRSPNYRQQLSESAQEIIRTQHWPANCADQYAQAIEAMYRAENSDITALTRALANVKPEPAAPAELIALAESVALSIPPRIALKQLLVDVSELVNHSAKSDIRKKVLSYVLELLTNPPRGFRVEPVYSVPDHGYRYARNFSLRLLSCPESALTDEVVEFQPCDQLLSLGLQPQASIAQQIFYDKLRNYGVKIQVVSQDAMGVENKT